MRNSGSDVGGRVGILTFLAGGGEMGARTVRGRRCGLTTSVAGVLTAVAVLCGPVIASGAQAQGSIGGSSASLPVMRVAGVDAIGTAIATSEGSFPVIYGPANAVVLARSDYFSDALAGGPLAALINGPLLITPAAALSATLDPRVLAEIQRVIPAGRGFVLILGGPLALSPSIDGTLFGLGYTVIRVSGPNQFATAVAIAGVIGEFMLGPVPTIFEATGLDFADALSAVPATIRAHGAILLTNGAKQSKETAAYLAAHPTVTRFAIGGPLAAAGADPSATPVYGDDLWGTSAAVARTFFPEAATFGASTGLNFPDALAGGPVLRQFGPMLLVGPHAPLPAPIASYLGTQANDIQGYLFGGPLAVDDDVLAALEAALG